MATLAKSCSKLWLNYTVFLERHPWKAQALNTSLLMGSGDFIAQVFLEGKRSCREYEKLRTARYLAVGLFMLGPSMHMWYTSLDKVIKGASTLRAATQKMLLDQSLFLPPYIVSFISVMAALRSEKCVKIKAMVQRDFRPILQSSYQLWPAVQMLNFYYVPLQHRIMVMNLVGLMWNTYIAWKAERKAEDHIGAEELDHQTNSGFFQRRVHLENLPIRNGCMEQAFLF